MAVYVVDHGYLIQIGWIDGLDLRFELCMYLVLNIDSLCPTIFFFRGRYTCTGKRLGLAMDGEGTRTRTRTSMGMGR